MKRPEEAIDRCLAGLREVEAPEGLESRVLARLQRAKQAPGSTVLARAGQASWAVAAGLVAVLSLVTGWGVFRRAEERPRLPARTSGGDGRSAGESAPAEREAVVEAEKAKGEVPVRGRRQKPVMQRRDAVEAWRQDPAFLRRMHGGSFPAPPEPLTAQERLLQQIVRRGDEIQKAELDPAVREKRNSDEAKAVLAFFEPPAAPQEVQHEKNNNEEKR